MVTKSPKQNKKGRTGRVKVGKLQLNKETVKNLTTSKAKGIRGGAVRAPECSDVCGGWGPNSHIEETNTCPIVSICGRCR